MAKLQIEIAEYLQQAACSMLHKSKCIRRNSSAVRRNTQCVSLSYRKLLYKMFKMTTEQAGL